MVDLFPGFSTRQLEVEPGSMIHARVGGAGPPLLLLHGFPQTHVIWHQVARRLAESFTVVAADLRGYGDSFKPPSAPDHAPHSKRAMARDQVRTMELLGFDSFHLVGHDRGGRVAHRLALDHPHRVRTVAVLDIAPTLHMYRRTDLAFARAYYHWFFLIQPEPMPERLIGAEAELYLRWTLGRGAAGLKPFADDALAEYIRCFRDPRAIHATCEDYRASAGIDLLHDEADLGKKVAAPLLVLWGKKGVVEACFDALAAWRERADSVTGRALDCGHYLPEEEPEAVADEIVKHCGAR